jgi:hypothetical protein
MKPCGTIENALQTDARALQITGENPNPAAGRPLDLESPSNELQLSVSERS